MLQKILTILLACSLALSCGEKEPQPENPPQQEQPGETPETPDDPTMQTITAAFPSLSMTKVGWEVLPDGLSAIWRNDDFLTIVSGDVEERYKIVSISEDGKVATLKGMPVDGEKYDIILSRFEEDVEGRTYEGQKQLGDGSTEHLHTFDVMLSGVDSYNELTLSEEWAGKHGGTYAQSGVLKLSVAIPTDAKVTDVVEKITLTAPTEIFRTNNVTDVLKKSVSIEANFSAGLDRKAELYLLTPMQAYTIPAGTALTVDLVIAKVHYRQTITLAESINVEPGKCANLEVEAASWELVNEWLDPSEWFVPYLNTLATNYLKMSYLYDNDYTSVWHSPWNSSNYWYDPYFEGWTITERTSSNPNGTTNYVRLPMVCVIDLGIERSMSTIDIRRRAKDKADNKNVWHGADNNGRDHTRLIEIWASTDVSNESGITIFPIATKDDLNAIDKAYSNMWARKTWTKIADVVWADDDNTVTKRIYPQYKKARYIKLVVPGPDTSVNKAPILSVADISVKGY